MTSKQAEREDAYADDAKDQLADDHLGCFDDDDEAWERRAGATIDAD
jgi:hypothetical protein